MGKKIIKMSVAAVCVVAAGVIGMKAYNVADQAKVNMLLAQNVDALSAGDYIETELAEQEQWDFNNIIATMCPYSSSHTCYKDITIPNAIGSAGQYDVIVTNYPYKDHTDNPKEKEVDDWVKEQEKKDEEWKNREPASITEIPNGKSSGSTNGNSSGSTNGNGSSYSKNVYSSIYWGKDVWWEEKDENGWYRIHIGSTRKTITTREDPSRWLKSHRDEVDRWLSDPKYFHIN